MRSPVREIFKKVDLNSIFSFAGGYPSADTFPIDDIKELVSVVFDKYGTAPLQYGATQGVDVLRKALSERYNVDIERVQITTSSQQGIDVCCRIFINPGDVILTSNPTYLGALQSFKSYRARLIGINYTSDVKSLRNSYERIIEQLREEGANIKFLYLIPDFQNPSGETLSLEAREMFVELADIYNFLIIEDSPYYELRYEGNSVASMYTLDSDRVLHLGSFSKIFAPGFRLGWIFGNPKLLDMIYVCKQSLDLCPPVFDQYLAAEFLQSGRLERNLEKSRALYKEKRDLMLKLLNEYMPSGIRWTIPEGGLFLFLYLPSSFDSVAFYDKSLSSGVAYVAGSFFFTEGGRNTMRLNFSFMSKEKIREGIVRLSQLLTDEII